jgi:VWFA-related protein
MIDAIPQRSPTALFTTMSGQLTALQDFTLDHALLKQAAERAFPYGSIAFSSLAGQDLIADPNARYTQPGFVTFAAKATCKAFQQIAALMATVPGRKNLIWISDSFPSQAPPEAHEPSKSFDGSDVQPAIAALSAARVAVYSVAVSGPEPRHQGVGKSWQPPTWQRPSAAGGGVSNVVPAAAPPEMIAVSDIAAGIVSDDLERTMRQSTMRLISEKTGGIACTTVNDLPGCVAKAMDDGSHYYEIAYYPTSDAPGNHTIIVKTKRSGITLTYRQNYDTDSIKPQP